MFTLRPSPRYRRRLKKLIRRNQKLQRRIEQVLRLLTADPSDPALKSHKVTADDGKPAISSEVTGDLRITWRYAKDAVDVIDLVNIGGHSGSKKVYR